MKKSILLMSTFFLGFTIAITTSQPVNKFKKPEPIRVEKKGKILYLEITEENWDSLRPGFYQFNEGKKNPAFEGKKITDLSLSELSNAKLDTNNNVVSNSVTTGWLKKYKGKHPNRIYECLANYLKRFNGIGRININGGPYTIFNLPYTIEYNEDKLPLPYTLMLSYMKGTKVLKIGIQNSRKDGTIEIEYTDDNNFEKIELKPNESWTFKPCSRKIKPKEYFPKYANKIKENPEMELSRVPEKVTFTTRVKIKNFGFINLEEKVYESEF